MKMYNTALNETGSDSEAFARAVEKYRSVRKTEKRLGRPRVVVPDDAAAQTHAAKHTDIENDIWNKWSARFICTSYQSSMCIG